MKRIVIDLDDTITINKSGTPYGEMPPNLEVIDKLREYKEAGFLISIHTARNMRSHNSNFGKICADTLPTIIEWLGKHDVPYDEVFVGKPWCGNGGFYVDDKAIRPQEFVDHSLAEIYEMIGEEAPQ